MNKKMTKKIKRALGNGKIDKGLYRKAKKLYTKKYKGQKIFG